MNIITNKRDQKEKFNFYKIMINKKINSFFLNFQMSNG
tara:strand:+ start:1920 stop:2033 length:114 start_codon:yes stop_codon:yes gene_type:complete